MMVPDYDKQRMTCICRSDKAVAGYVDGFATLLSVSKNGTATLFQAFEVEQGD